MFIKSFTSSRWVKSNYSYIQFSTQFIDTGVGIFWKIYVNTQFLVIVLSYKHTLRSQKVAEVVYGSFSFAYKTFGLFNRHLPKEQYIYKLLSTRRNGIM